ncbi:pyridoxamine 5'-phosphate oxidase family protein [Granulicella sibirica]|nr:pyridoxamine 5'-phosphate oxidase family protein [Granulicella sibirica]
MLQELTWRPRLEESATIPEAFLDLFQGKHIPHFTTLLADGSPRCSLVWCDFDGMYLRFSVTTKHITGLTVANDPRVVCMVADPAVLDRYIEVRGVIEKIVPDPEADHVYRLASLRGVVQPVPYPGASDRVILYMKPTVVFSFPGYHHHY